jgi:hypothetical protein
MVEAMASAGAGRKGLVHGGLVHGEWDRAVASSLGSGVPHGAAAAAARAGGKCACQRTSAALPSSVNP